MLPEYRPLLFSRRKELDQELVAVIRTRGASSDYFCVRDLRILHEVRMALTAKVASRWLTREVTHYFKWANIAFYESGCKEKQFADDWMTVRR